MSSMTNNNNAELLRHLAEHAARRLQSAGFVAFWAGGCVRDMLMGQSPKDFDIATNATPDQIISLFPEAITVGKSFGVVRAPIGDAYFEIATFRQDHSYKDGRRPESVSFTDAATDAQRRDFTINAIFYDPAAKAFHDYTGGMEDIHKRIVRCVGNPEERITEDHLRMLRAVRFASVLEFSIEPRTAAAIRQHAALITRISAERIRDEINRVFLESPRAGDALALMADLGLLQEILPEVAAMRGQAQPPEFHPEGDVFDHTALMLNMMDRPSLHLVYAILLHDVGKPPTAQLADDRIRFDRHAAEGAELAAAILHRLRFSSEDTAAIVYCVRNHMRFMDVPRMKRSTLRRLIAAPTFNVELETHRLDCLASHGSLDNYMFLTRFIDENSKAPILPKPWITGHDIMKLGVPEGPQVGLWRKTAYDAQLEERFGAREELLNWLKEKIVSTQEPEVRIQESE